MTEANGSYRSLLPPLRTAYDAKAAWRDGLEREPWKLTERELFRRRLAPGDRLLEIGAGAGHDSAYFQEEGMSVVATDLSPGMVERCRANGIEAHVMDSMGLEFPADSFDAVFTMNCLLHVPNQDLPEVLCAVRTVLRPGGFFYFGVYGASESFEGPLDNDTHAPPRFFSWRTDALLRDFAVAAGFHIVDFHRVETDRGHPFQAMTLRRPNITGTLSD